jgi:hypothetical protein
MKPFLIDDQLLDADAIEGLRENLIQLRDAALTAGQMDWAVSLSLSIAVFAKLIEAMKQEEQPA